LIEDAATKVVLVRAVNPCVTSCPCKPPPVTAAFNVVAAEDAWLKSTNATVKSTSIPACEGSHSQ
jgi:hypothetical protein